MNQPTPSSLVAPIPRLAHVWRADPFRKPVALASGYYAMGRVTVFLRHGERFPRGMV